MKKQLIIEILAGLLILLFVYTGLFKILTPGIMEMDLQKSEQPPILRAFATPLAYLIQIAELLVAVLLFFPKYRKLGFYGALILMIVFTLYVGYILFFFHGIQRPCTCGGIFRKLTWENHFIVNLIYSGISLAGCVLEREKEVGHDTLETPGYRISQ